MRKPWGEDSTLSYISCSLIGWALSYISCSLIGWVQIGGLIRTNDMIKEGKEQELPLKPFCSAFDALRWFVLSTLSWNFDDTRRWTLLPQDMVKTLAHFRGNIKKFHSATPHIVLVSDICHTHSRTNSCGHGYGCESTSSNECLLGQTI